MQLRVLCLMLMPLVMQAQTSSTNNAITKLSNYNDSGIQWVTDLSWQEILQKAKSEHKLIFVDCYATWCAPCKAMDKNVYPSVQVGQAMNEKFISVKVQMDRTEKDDNRVKSWYKDAKAIEKQYQINAFPTLLFFSQDGALVHRVTQGLNIEGFLNVVATALDPKKRYSSLLADYQNRQRDTMFLLNLIFAAQAAYDNNTAQLVAKEFIATLTPKSLYNKQNRDIVKRYGNTEKGKEIAGKYIDGLKQNEIFTIDNIVFIRQFTKSSKQRGFRLFYNYPHKINSIMEGIVLDKGAISKTIKGDYAQSAVRGIIFSEEIYKTIFAPAQKNISNVKDPEWEKLTISIRKKYPKIDADRLINESKIPWYRLTKNWPEYSKSLLKQMDYNYKGRSLVGLTLQINDNCWDLFEKSCDSAILSRAIYWMEQVFSQIEKDRDWSTALDTYANLLYKVGRTKEALQNEEKAVKISPDEKDITQAFDRMKKGLPTWPQL
jgi:thiol-disulfide isomerase/thioredoxin